MNEIAVPTRLAGAPLELSPETTKGFTIPKHWLELWPQVTPLFSAHETCIRLWEAYQYDETEIWWNTIQAAFLAHDNSRTDDTQGSSFERYVEDIRLIFPLLDESTTDYEEGSGFAWEDANIRTRIEVLHEHGVLIVISLMKSLADNAENARLAIISSPFSELLEILDACSLKHISCSRQVDESPRWHLQGFFHEPTSRKKFDDVLLRRGFAHREDRYIRDRFMVRPIEDNHWHAVNPARSFSL